MKNRGQHRIIRNRKAAVRKEPISWGYFVLTIFCASMMALGFFFVAVQHFVAMDLGFKNSSMRKQIQDLEAEKRRLLLTKEVALSPNAITRAATKFGFREVEEVVATNSSDQLTTEPKQRSIGASREVTAIVSTKPVNQASQSKKADAIAERPAKVEVKAGIESRPRVAEAEKETPAQLVTSVAKLR
jgi:hypothetical protein